MLYPRTTGAGKLVSDRQMVDPGEHLFTKHRVVLLHGTIGGSSELPLGLLALDSISHEPIKLVITSGGGDLTATLLLYDVMKLVKAPIYTFGRFCASAAVLILAVGAKRFLSPHAKVMLHVPRVELGSSLFGSTYTEEELQVLHQETAKYRRKIVDLLVECGAKKTASEILQDIQTADFWLEPQEAVDYGLADEVMTKDVLGTWLS